MEDERTAVVVLIYMIYHEVQAIIINSISRMKSPWFTVVMGGRIYPLSIIPNFWIMVIFKLVLSTVNVLDQVRKGVLFLVWLTSLLSLLDNS